MGTEATLDPGPGGVCRINPSGHGVMLGQFVEVDPPRRVVFTWGWEIEILTTPPQSTLVEVSLTPDGEGTNLRLAHRRLHVQAVAFHRVDWEDYLARLALVTLRHRRGRRCLAGRLDAGPRSGQLWELPRS